MKTPFPFLNSKVMAKKKMEAPIEEQTIEQTVDKEINESIEEQIQDLSEEQEKEEVVKQTDEKEQEVCIPEHIDKILAQHPEYPELYVDMLGGVFPKDVQLNLVKGAILYQNPYYNK